MRPLSIVLAPPISVRFTADDRASLYFDGEFQDVANWPVYNELHVTTTPHVIALEGTDYDGVGFGVMLWMSNGYVTDTSWKCINAQSISGDAWRLAGYDDSAWPAALMTGDSTTADDYLGCTGAVSIWADCWSQCRNVNCRKEF